MDSAIYRDVLEKIASAFALPGKISSIERYGSGHIHDTLKVSCEGEFIVQRINTNVFPEPFKVMENIDKVTKFLKERVGSSKLKTLSFLKRCDTKSLLYEDDNGSFWRVAELIPDSISFDRTDDPLVLKEGGRAFGAFLKDLISFDPKDLHETIPRFHDTPHRFKLFEEAIKNDKVNRASTVQKEIDELRKLLEYSSVIQNELSLGKLTLRVTHNDTKINNVLFSKKDKKALCVVDLDTVMPGSMLYDFGDLVRTTCSTGDEDERDLSKVRVNLDSLRAISSGYLGEVSGCISQRERELLYTSSIAMTHELSLRFLTDYLNGDEYFKVQRPGHNLDRARAQLALSRELLRNRNEGEKIILKAISL